MPGGDRTGPLGLGPITGRGAGYCRGSNTPGYANPIFGAGRGFRRGFGMGRGRGWRHCYYTTGLPGGVRAERYPYGYGNEGNKPSRSSNVSGTKASELALLKEEASYLNDTLKDISKRIAELEK